MYCPNCAAPIDGTKFCRSCGTNVSLVPQALTGQLPTQVAVEDERRGRHRHRGKRPPSIEKAASSFFTGLGFVLVALAARRFAPAGEIWWFWMLIPAFACIGEGVGQFWRVRAERQAALQNLNSPARLPEVSQPALPQMEIPNTSDLENPSSVTEHTTRHLEH